MRPQKDEPCVNCKNWSNRTGCKIGRYDSTAMVIWGVCGKMYFEPKTRREKKGDGA